MLKGGGLRERQEGAVSGLFSMPKVRGRMNCLKGAGRQSTEQGKEGDKNQQMKERRWQGGGRGMTEEKEGDKL